ncbi:hypothetical protein PAL_GLEAN10007397 [Pteropus alecto]|uniref:Uncharacterized protein n=1 Tax=Pteropus alecto TaxID=9402 RepID=L5L3J9_PTEAL|nr:hypothetical protein PAL_GLEAN10007397 [Pteropus alecto]
MSSASALLLSDLEVTEANSSYVLGNCETQFVYLDTYLEILRIIQLDLDLKYKTNIRELFEEFDNFLPGAIIGIAREMQPVYRLVSEIPKSGFWCALAVRQCFARAAPCSL